MPTKRGNPRRPRVVIDLTSSDDEVEDTGSSHIPNVKHPDPSNAHKPRHLTAAECLRADQIAYGEIDPEPDSQTRDPLYPLVEGRDQVGHHEVSFQGCAPNFPSHSSEKRSVSHSIPSSSEDEDFSHHESALYQKEDSSGLTGFEQTPEVVETIASGRPRRACAPRSFEGFMLESSFESEEFSSVDEVRSYLIERATIAHRRLWENRIVDNFLYCCGRIDGGNVRHAMIHVAQSFGATCKVERRSESGKKGRYVVLKWSRRLRPATELKIQESVDRILNRLYTPSNPYSTPQSANIETIIRHEARGLEKNSPNKEKGKTKLETSKGSKKVAESRQEVRNCEWTLNSGEALNEDKVRSNLIECATIAYRELWENRLVSGFKYSCGRIDDGSIRSAIVQVAHSFGALCKVEKRSESGEEVKHVVLKCTRHLRPPVELNIQEIVNRCLIRLQNLSDTDARDPKDPCHSTQGGITNDSKQARTRSATFHHEGLMRRKVSSKGDIGRARTKDTRKSMFQHKRQRKLEGTKIGTINKGFSMLTKMGWTEGGRLGAKEDGISEPIVAQFRIGRGGLGTK